MTFNLRIKEMQYQTRRLQCGLLGTIYAGLNPNLTHVIFFSSIISPTLNLPEFLSMMKP